MELGIAALLRAAWICGTLPILIALIPSSRLNSYKELLLGFAKRGKILQTSSHKYTVPQRFFCHFYVVAVVWTTLLIVATWFYAYRMAPSISEPLVYSTIASHLTGGSHIFSLHRSRSATEYRYMAWRSLFLLLLMEAQVLRRLFETIYVFKYSPSARMHIFGYLTGLFFYTAAPLSLCCTNAPEVFKFAANRVLEFIVKGKDRMKVTEFDLRGLVNPLIGLKWYAWIGAAIFFWGWIHQHRCHVILGSLRENTEVEDYVIPHGDWFDLVSSPHYLAEIVIYAGLVVASGGGDLTIWLLLAFVVANLVFAAAETQRWYLRKFDNYPSDRSAVIPYVY